MITEGEAASLMETTQRAYRNQSQSKQRSTLIAVKNIAQMSQLTSQID